MVWRYEGLRMDKIVAEDTKERIEWLLSARQHYGPKFFADACLIMSSLWDVKNNL